MKQNRHAYLRAWLAAHGRFERDLRVKVARARNRYIRDAAKAYEETGSVPQYVTRRYTSEIESLLIASGDKVALYFGAFATRGVKKRHGVLERKASTSFLARIQNWVRTNALANATAISGTDADIIRARINEGLAAGDGAAAIARNIRKASGLSSVRAAMIARTETHSAANYGAIEETREVSGELGIVMEKEWIATNDDRTRQSHIDADGQTVGIDEAFEVDNESLGMPGDTSASAENIINCRCAVAYSEVL
jgi:SPP1 gp7 family putative phage head morphogenesis protein